MSMKIKIAAAALAAVTLGASVIATSEAQARPRFGLGLGIGFAAGALIGAAAASNAYAEPAYVDYGYRRCRFVRQFDAFGYYVGTTRVCGY